VAELSVDGWQPNEDAVVTQSQSINTTVTATSSHTGTITTTTCHLLYIHQLTTTYGSRSSQQPDTNAIRYRTTPCEMSKVRRKADGQSAESVTGRFPDKTIPRQDFFPTYIMINYIKSAIFEIFNKCIVVDTSSGRFRYHRPVGGIVLSGKQPVREKSCRETSSNRLNLPH